ncbi:MAG: alternative ribosome rescue aminoacyl-tRNA hydrolase ArfB [Antricoccus sp.]
MPRGLRIRSSELIEKFSRSAGPGGQGVNTTDSRVQLLFYPGESAAFSPLQYARLSQRLGDELIHDAIVIAASEYRSQYRNRVAARVRLSQILREAIGPPPRPRRDTVATRGSQRRRLASKKRRGETKRLRRSPSADS